MRLLAPALVAVLLVPLALAETPQDSADARGDPRSRSFLGLARCVDPSLDVVESSVVIGEAFAVLRVRVADAGAAFACEPRHFEMVGLPWKRTAVRTVHVYTEDYADSGIYLVWHSEETPARRDAVRVYDPVLHRHGSLDGSGTLVGDTWTLTVPTVGTAVMDDGTTFRYVLREPFRYYGVTEGTYLSPVHTVVVEDRFGATFGA